MINKEHLWFITLFSLILVLCVYYVTMPNDLLLSSQVFDSNNEKKTDKQVNLEVKESDVLVSLRLDLDENRKLEKKNLEAVLTNTDASIDDKNAAYEKINYINSIYGVESKLEKKVKECCNIDSFVEVDSNEVNVVGVSKNHSVNTANDIMRAIQEEFKNKVTISVSFK